MVFNIKAIISPRITLENRTQLQDVIPLSTPFILFIDPSSYCNLRCKFCPNGHPKLIRDTGRFQGNIDFELYKKIIDDLQQFNKSIKVLRLYKDGEPLLNTNFDKMVKYAKDSGKVQYVDTTTNGVFINTNRMKSIIDAGLDKINISVNGLSNTQFLEFTGVNISFDKYVKNIKNLYEIKRNCEIVIKINGDYLSEIEKQFFYNTFGNICDKIFIEKTANCWTEFDVEKYTNIKLDSEKGIYNQPIHEINICPYIFYQMSINSDGKVSLCFLDWQHKMIIGDVKNQSLIDIWNSNKLLKYQLMNLRGNRKDHSVCKNCGQLSRGQPDNIDNYTDVLIEKIGKTKCDL